MDNKRWWQSSIEETAQALETDLEKGLSSIDAKERLKNQGYNQLPEVNPPSVLKLFFRQFSSFVIWILIVAALLAGVLAEWADTIAILAIVFLNALIGFFQERKAEKSLAALKKLTTPTCKVIREKQLQTVLAKELVPGDLVLLEAGDLVPADGRVVYSVELSTQEASLTGESLPVHKIQELLDESTLPLSDQKNMVFMGTLVLSGKSRILVTGTGLNSELGKIAKMLKESKEEKTPLQMRLEQLGQKLAYLCLAIVLAVFLLGVIRGNPFLDILLTAISLAVAAVPEGLPAIVTIALAIGVKRMAKKKALIRRLPSVETLGCASVICTDKTGTLTKNEMSVRKIWVSHKEIDLSGSGYGPRGEFTLEGAPVSPQDMPDLLRVLEICVLCNSANLIRNDQGWQVVGDPTEGALIVAALKANLKKEELEAKVPLLGEIPFNSERKRMSMKRKKEGQELLFTKGAPDLILDRCEKLLVEGKEERLTEQMKQEILAANHKFASSSMRVLALAYKKIPSGCALNESVENAFVFAGLVAMMDPPRPGVKQAIATCKQAGILPVMVTGDHKDTAVAIAKEIGLMQEDGFAISGIELDKMSEEELQQSLKKAHVFARISAEHKLRIVRAFKNAKLIVAVTGDGVNDAPAIKEGNIGVAMGIKGTDVTKEAADMIILDDNFASIVSAVEEGRGIYDNILKFVNYLLSCNIAELLVIFIAMTVGFTDPTGTPFVPLTALQLLFLNLVTDGFPAIALGVDPIDPHIMQRKPHPFDEPILSRNFTYQILAISALITIGVIIACYYGLKTSAPLAQTMTLTTFVVLELVRVQMVRSRYNIGFFSNPWVTIALISSLLFQLVVIYLAPLQRIFGTVALDFKEWAVILGVAAGVAIGGSLINRLISKR